MKDTLREGQDGVRHYKLRKARVRLFSWVGWREAGQTGPGQGRAGQGGAGGHINTAAPTAATAAVGWWVASLLCCGAGFMADVFCLPSALLALPRGLP